MPNAAILSVISLGADFRRLSQMDLNLSCLVAAGEMPQ
jgi:hypothetical protein